MPSASLDDDLRELAEAGQVGLALKLQNKRNERAEKSKRLLDPRIRQIGASADEWERQIAHKNECRQAEADMARDDRAVLEKLDRIAQQIEAERQEDQRQREASARHHSLNKLGKTARREYFLSDPKRDLSIDIEHVGPSAAQVFAGEFVEDKKAMQEELVRGLEGQEEENKELLEREAALELAFAELSKLDFETRLAIDTEEEASTRAARRALDEYNAELQKGRNEKQKRMSQYSEASAIRDIDFHLRQSELLNGDIGTNSDFKGVSLKGKQEVLESQAQQVEQRIRRVTEENDRTARDAAQAEAQRLEAVRIHDEQEKQRRSAAKALVEENMRLAEDQNRVRMRTEETYAPSIKETFFDQFAKSACH